MLPVFKQIGAITRPNIRSTVLLTGETGVGKTRFARLIHDRGTTQNLPFVTVHCAGVPTELLSNELFGHDKGAYTGADHDHMGRIEAAGAGTVFLDELGELQPDMQVKLLRLLDTGEYERLGSTATRVAKCRFIGATHRDLEAEVKAGRFRADLYHRLRVIQLHIPPLRERPGDIDFFADVFVDELARKHKRPLRLSPSARELLHCYPFPGNVRELKHAIVGAASLTNHAVLHDDVFPYLAPKTHVAQTEPNTDVDDGELQVEALWLSGTWDEAKTHTMERLESRFVHHQLSLAEGNVSQAARRAGVSRQYFQRLMRRHDVLSEAFRPTSRLTLVPPSDKESA